MGNRVVLGLVIVAAVAGLFFLMGGMDLLGSGDVGGEGPGEGGGDATALEERGGAGDAAEAGSGAKGADGLVLFGRSRAERVGRGGLEGRVMDFKSGEPLGGVSVTLAGRGYADEVVALQATTSVDGWFQLPDVPAGDAYVLHLQDPKGRQRALRSQSVDAHRVTDAGTIWIGAKGILRGVVTDAAGTPLAGADVQVHPGSGSMLEMFRDLTKMLEQLDKDAEPVARGKTDAKGRFEIRGVPPGPFTLVVRAAGHQQAMQKIVMTSEGAAGGPVEIRLAPAEAVVGVVVDEQGRGIAGARVACLEKNQMEGMLFGRQFTKADAQGRFQVASPPSRGGFAVIVKAAGYPTLLTEGKAGQSHRFVLVRGADVILRVLEEGTGHPLEGAQLTAMFSDRSGSIDTNVNMVSGVTDARGEARVRARPGSLGMLWLQHPERGTAVFAAMAGPIGSGALKGPEDVTVKRPRTTLEFRLTTGLELRGRVTDPDDAPLEGARVAVLGSMGLGGQARTDGEGRYRIPGQSKMVTMVLVTKAGYVQTSESMRAIGAAAGDVLEHDVVMRRAASIVGRVLDEEGRPVAGVRVRPSADGSRAVASLIDGSKPSITNEDGRYVLTGALPGEKTTVVARHPGYLDSKTEEFRTKESGATQAPDLVLKRGSWIDVRVEGADGAAVAGARVEVSADGARDVAWDPLGALSEFADLATGEDGTVRVRDVPDGEVTVTASKTGHASSRGHLTVKREAGGGAHQITVRLRRGATLRGRVLDADDRPIAGATVSTGRPGAEASDEESWMPFRTVETEEDGGFEFPDLPTVSFTLVVSADGYQGTTLPAFPGRGDVEVRLTAVDPEVAAQLEQIDAELMRIYQAFGSVKDDAERAALGRRIQALQEQKRRLEGK